MQLYCARVQAIFPSVQISLENRAPAPLLLDEHGGSFILRVEGLQVAEWSEPPAQFCFRLEVSLPAEGSWLDQVSEFASQQSLSLSPGAPSPGELVEEPILSAAHVPGKTLFIYCEDSLLRVRPTNPETLELTVTGQFKSRRIPCRETDLIIHLTPAATTRLLSLILSLARERR